MFRTRLLQVACAFLLVIANSGVNTACWYLWYQPKMPIE
ncbi:MAG: cyclic lactone autoinducer peptide [Firmicutes bacterium HGW-Firmicutes-15]|nr:MAG: cyclic lactone autoinducer peptide [Firmicutes bacterium HGW-Firmicutes-15]